MMDLRIIASRVAVVETKSKIRQDGAYKFDMNEFRKLNTAEMMNDYASKSLKKIGTGSSRKVYALTSRKVLKIASELRVITPGAGMAQNKAEVEVYTNPSTRPIVTKIFEFDNEYKWITSEIVRNVTREEFGRLSGCEWESIVAVLEMLEYPDTTKEILVKELKEQGFSGLTDEMFDSVMSLVDQGIITGDLKMINHWGKSADGRVVIMDYGFSEEVHANFYDKDDLS